MPLRAVSLLLHAYVAWRLAPSLGWVGGGALLAVLVVTALTLPFAFGARRRGRAGRYDRALVWIGMVGMGLFSSLFVGSVLRDVAALALGVVDAVRPGTIGAAALATFAVVSAQVVVAAAALASGWGFVNARRTPPVVRVDVPIADLPVALQGFRLAQISDVHVGPTIRGGYVQAVVERINREEVDLVAITGDLVDGSVRDLGEQVAPLAELKSRDGTFFVTGNHEYYSGAASWIHELRRLGLTVLLNEHAVVGRGDSQLVLAGVTDYGAGHFDRAQASDPARALAGAPADAAVRVLLAHQPRSAAAAEQAGFDLQLSGHTHGGQFWPWNHFVRLQQPFTAGLHRLRRLWVYTSRGTGYWGPPKRFGAPSEITVLRLVPAPG